jgi:hypothetical protein
VVSREKGEDRTMLTSEEIPRWLPEFARPFAVSVSTVLLDPTEDDIEITPQGGIRPLRTSLTTVQLKIPALSAPVIVSRAERLHAINPYYAPVWGVRFRYESYQGVFQELGREFSEMPIGLESTEETKAKHVTMMLSGTIADMVIHTIGAVL